MDASFLPSEDNEFLNGNDFDWEPLVENSKNGLMIRKYALPKGYTPKEICLMLLIPSGYPTSPIDMFYFRPPILRIDGGEIASLADETHFGRIWQRWSRHYLPDQWRDGVDNVATHIAFIENVLKSELGNA